MAQQDPIPWNYLMAHVDGCSCEMQTFPCKCNAWVWMQYTEYGKKKDAFDLLCLQFKHISIRRAVSKKTQRKAGPTLALRSHQQHSIEVNVNRLICVFGSHA